MKTKENADVKDGAQILNVCESFSGYHEPMSFQIEVNGRKTTLTQANVLSRAWCIGKSLDATAPWTWLVQLTMRELILGIHLSVSLEVKASL